MKTTIKIVLLLLLCLSLSAQFIVTTSGGTRQPIGTYASTYTPDPLLSIETQIGKTRIMQDTPAYQDTCQAPAQDGHYQGVDCDDDYIYWSSSDSLFKTDYDGTVVARVIASKDANMRHAGSFTRVNDKLYVPLSNHDWSTSSVDSIVVYNTSDLSRVSATDISATCSHGIGGLQYHDGYFWGGTSANPPSAMNVYKYNTSFTVLDTFFVKDFTSGYGCEALEFIQGKWYIASYDENTWWSEDFSTQFYTDATSFIDGAYGTNMIDKNTFIFGSGTWEEGAGNWFAEYTIADIYETSWEKYSDINLTTDFTYTLTFKTVYPSDALISGVSFFKTQDSEMNCYTDKYWVYCRMTTDEDVFSTRYYKTNFPANIWYTISCTYSSDRGSMRMFYNGALIDTISVTGTFDCDDRFFLGKNYFVGNFRECRLYNTCMTDTEISTMYSTGAIIYSANLEFFIKVNAGQGNKAYDLSGNEHHGKIGHVLDTGIPNTGFWDSSDEDSFGKYGITWVTYGDYKRAVPYDIDGNPIYNNTYYIFDQDESYTEYPTP